jgi:hypothetical protein
MPFLFANFLIKLLGLACSAGEGSEKHSQFRQRVRHERSVRPPSKVIVNLSGK